MKTLPEYRDLILQWANDRGFAEGATVEGQLDKLFEELGEYAGAAARSANPAKRDEMLVKMKDGLGDVFVVICILSDMLDIELDLVEYEEYNEPPRKSALYLSAGCIAGVVAARAEGLLSDLIGDDEPFLWTISVAEAVAKMHGFDYLECVDMAWNEIKDRKGRMIDGVFVKESDL